MSGSDNTIKVGILPGLADLYTRLYSQEVIGKLTNFIAGIPNTIGSDLITFEIGNLSSSAEQMSAEVDKLTTKNIDLLIVLLAPYCPSGAIVSALMKSRIPILLWPAQTIYEFVPDKVDQTQLRLSHGVHAVQDLANILRKRNKPFGVLHGHDREKDFRAKFETWAQAAQSYTAFVRSNPIQIGDHFHDMLDLQITDTQFIADCGIKMIDYDLSQFKAEIARTKNINAVEARVKAYKEEFDIASDVSHEMLKATARKEIVLRAIMKKHNSHACGINFQTLCNDPNIGDPMHVAASRLMAEGKGYAGEGDWVTAAMVYAAQSAFGKASLSEIFSVDYKNNRVFLLHWGEANPKMAREKPRIINSSCNDKINTEFCIIDMQFATGPSTLINLNANSHGNGQLISIKGEITEDRISTLTGPRAMFKPECPDIHKLLDEYAYSGGSHHLALVNGCAKNTLQNLSTLTGWSYKAL